MIEELLSTMTGYVQHTSPTLDSEIFVVLLF
jgi:hypothetical protein